MSIPTTDIQPDSLHRAPRNQSQQVRKVLENAGPRQIKDFIADLIRRNQLNVNSYWHLLLSLALLAIGLIADLPLLVLLAAVTAPVLNPMIGLVLSAIKPSVGYFGKSLLFVLITIAAFLGTGWLINQISPSTINPDQITSFFALRNGWLEWGVLVLTSIISVYLFLYRSGGPSVVTSTVMAYLIFIPITLAVLLLVKGDQQAALNLLVLSGVRFFISLLVLLLTTWLFGFAPKGSLGWLLFAIVVIVSALTIFELRSNPSSFSTPESTPINVVAVVPTDEPIVETQLSPTDTPIPTQNPQPTATKMQTLTVVATPASQYALVISESGVVVRQSPSTQALIVTYVNNGMQVTLLGEQTTAEEMTWEKVIAPDGKEGWVAAQFLQAINP